MISAALSQGTWLELAAGQEEEDDMPLAERDRLTTLLAAAYTPPSHTQPDDVEERQNRRPQQSGQIHLSVLPQRECVGSP